MIYSYEIDEENVEVTTDIIVKLISLFGQDFSDIEKDSAISIKRYMPIFTAFLTSRYLDFNNITYESYPAIYISDLSFKIIFLPDESYYYAWEGAYESLINEKIEKNKKKEVFDSLVVSALKLHYKTFGTP